MSIDTEHTRQPESSYDVVTAAIIAWSDALHTPNEYELDPQIV